MGIKINMFSKILFLQEFKVKLNSVILGKERTWELSKMGRDGKEEAKGTEICRGWLKRNHFH